MLAFGYLVNDLSDFEADRAAGKKRAAHQFSLRDLWFICGLLVVVGVIALWPYLFLTRLNPVLVASSFLLAGAYSLAPVRLKERGWLGLVAASAAQRSVPALAAAACLGAFDSTTSALAVIYFLNGLRYIILHQILDSQNDRIASIHTYILQGNRLSSSGHTLNIVFTGELAALALLPILFTGLPKWFGLFTWAYVVYWVLRSLLSKHHSHPLSYARMPLETLYFLIWPLLFLNTLRLSNAYFCLLYTSDAADE